jgi:phosphate transport system substrate-binding protein
VLRRQAINCGMIKCFAVIYIAALALCGSAPASAETLTIAGSTTVDAFLMAPHRREIEALSGHQIVLAPNRTSTGIKQLYDGRADLAMASTDLESTRHALRGHHPNRDLERLQNTVVCRTRSAFTIHPDNPVKSASEEQIKKILLGEITNWKDLGGLDEQIKLVVVREGGGAELSIVAQLLSGMPISAPSIIRVQIASQINKVVEQESSALGLAQVENMKGRRVKEIITNAQVQQELALVWLDEPTSAMQAVIAATKQIAARQTPSCRDER